MLLNEAATSYSFGFTFVTASFAYFFKIYKNVVVTKSRTTQTTPQPTPTPDPLRIRNILLLGYAGGDHDGASLTDTIILARIYPKDKKIKLLSIPRDIWVPLPVSKGTTQHFKINHAFAIGLDDKKYPNKDEQYKGLYGAGTMARDAVSIITGITPENFIAINFQGFKTIVDELGGITVNVPYTFKDNYYPLQGLENDPCEKSDDDIKALTATISGDLLDQQFACRYETIDFKKGQTALDGETALKFVRSRHSDFNGNDFGRALRQQALLVGIKNKILSYGTLAKAISLINTLSKNLITDIDIKTALQIASEQDTFTDFTIESYSLTTDNVLTESLSSDRQYILIPKEGEDNWSGVRKYLQENF